MRLRNGSSGQCAAYGGPSAPSGRGGELAEHVGELEGICRAAETSRKLFLLDKVT